jgi:hypothetical protein
VEGLNFRLSAQTDWQRLPPTPPSSVDKELSATP